MKGRGQVFTFDMLLALIMAMVIVSSSGVALSITRERTSSYVSRYSLNSIASDSADVLVKSSGKPVDWISNLDNLKTPGLASFDNNLNRAVPNKILVEKIGHLRELTRENNWDVSKPETQAIMGLFGGTQNFEISIFQENNLLWKFWPGWDGESASGVENSLEVASVNRSGYLTSLIKTRLATDPLIKMENNSRVENYRENWEIYEGELESYDWYLYVRTSKEEENQVLYVKIGINRDSVNDYEFRPKDDGWYEIYPSEHGGMEDDDDLKNSLVEGTNNLEISVKPKGGKKDALKDWAELYVIAAPACMKPEDVVFLQEAPIRLQVKVWR